MVGVVRLVGALTHGLVPSLLILWRCNRNNIRAYFFLALGAYSFSWVPLLPFEGALIPLACALSSLSVAGVPFMFPCVLFMFCVSLFLGSPLLLTALPFVGAVFALLLCVTWSERCGDTMHFEGFALKNVCDCIVICERTRPCRWKRCKFYDVSLSPRYLCKVLHFTRRQKHALEHHF